MARFEIKHPKPILKKSEVIRLAHLTGVQPKLYQCQRSVDHSIKQTIQNRKCEKALAQEIYRVDKI